MDKDGNVVTSDSSCAVTFGLVTSWNSGSMRGPLARVSVNGLVTATELRVSEETEAGAYHLMAKGSGLCENLEIAISDEFQVN